MQKLPRSSVPKRSNLSETFKTGGDGTERPRVPSGPGRVLHQPFLLNHNNQLQSDKPTQKTTSPSYNYPSRTLPSPGIFLNTSSVKTKQQNSVFAKSRTGPQQAPPICVEPTSTHNFHPARIRSSWSQAGLVIPPNAVSGRGRGSLRPALSPIYPIYFPIPAQSQKSNGLNVNGESAVVRPTALIFCEHEHYRSLSRRVAGGRENSKVTDR